MWALAILAACGGYVQASPADYRGANVAQVVFLPAEMVRAKCASLGKTSCVIDRVMYLPNPCEWPDAGRYDQLACHELGHVNGWPADHPKR